MDHEVAGSKRIPPLRLNMQILADGCNDLLLDVSFYNRERDTMRLIDVALYYGQDMLSEEYVYLAEAGTLRDHPIDNQDISLLAIGDPGDWYRSMANPMLVFPADISLPQLHNTIRSIFRRYFSFELQLHQALESGSLSEMANLALDFFQNPLFIHDENFVMLCRPQYVSGMSDVDVSTGVATFKMELISHFKTDPDYIRTLSSRRASLWIKNTRPYYTAYRVLYMNLFDHIGRYRGRICINEINSSLLPSQFQMLEFFSLFVNRLLSRAVGASRKEQPSFEAFLRSYLRGNPPGRDSALRLITIHKWQEHDTYVCVKIQLTDRDLAMCTSDNAVRALSTFFPKSSVFPEDDSIWMVENLTREGFTAEEFRQRVREFSRSGMFPAGVSDLFHDFFRLRSGFQQAALALQYQHCRPQTAEVSWFPQMVNYFFMNCAARQADPAALCHERLFELRAMDRERGTEYYKTLRVYLENERKLTETAQSLHVHRSTLQYRIDKLGELLQLSLDDAELRLYLLNCFRLLDAVN